MLSHGYIDLQNLYKKFYAIHFYIIVCWISEIFIIFYVLKNATLDLICREQLRRRAHVV